MIALHNAFRYAKGIFSKFAIFFVNYVQKWRSWTFFFSLCERKIFENHLWSKNASNTYFCHLLVWNDFGLETDSLHLCQNAGYSEEWTYISGDRVRYHLNNSFPPSTTALNKDREGLSLYKSQLCYPMTVCIDYTYLI